jgi:hypothetical protein
MKINAKTFAGVGLGLVAGYFLFKNNNKKFLYISGMGLAGGLLANFVLNRETKKPVTRTTEKYIESAEYELPNEETGTLPVVEVPTIYPLTERASVKENFDIDLGIPQNN